MEYLLLIHGDPGVTPQSDAEHQALFGDFQKWHADLVDRGMFVTGNPLGRDSTTTVRVRVGKQFLTDGPFAETKEFLGGFVVIRAESLDVALDVAKACPGARYGSVEIHPVVEPVRV